MTPTHFSPHPARAEDRRAMMASSRTPRPLVGLTTYFGETSHGVWDKTPAAFLNASYIERIVAAGGRPVLLPPVGAWTLEEVADLDALVLTGGDDIDPARYGAERRAATGPENAARDEFELELYAAARTLGIPVLGICRGVQLINVAHGGTLHQHLPDVPELDHPSAGEGFTELAVRTAGEGLLAEILGETVSVQCYHHQGIDAVGRGLAVTAAHESGLPEALELRGEEPGFVVGVQWHPEQTPTDERLFAALLAAARRFRHRAEAETLRAAVALAELPIAS